MQHKLTESSEAGASLTPLHEHVNPPTGPPRRGFAPAGSAGRRKAHGGEAPAPAASRAGFRAGFRAGIIPPVAA